MSTLTTITKSGIPVHSNMSYHLQSSTTTNSMTTYMYTFDGVILYKDRILIQPSLQQAIPDVLHGAHNKGNFHNCKWRIHHFLPSHQASHHCITCKLLLMQPLGHISTVYTTLPVNDTLVQLCRLLPLQKGELPSSSRQILQLANHLTSMQRFYRAN